MGDFLSGSAGSSQRVVIYSGLQVGTSLLDIPIGWMRGQCRMSPNVIDYVDFKKHKQSAKGKGGGKGGGQYTYSAAVDLALGWGTVTETLNVWAQGSTTTTTTLGAIGYSLLTNAAWAYMVTAHPDHALVYPNISRIVNENADLGSSASVPDIGVEAKLCPYADVFVSDGYKDPDTGAITPGADVNMADFLPDFLTGSLGGMGMPSSYLPDLTEFRAYQAAQGLFFSPYLKNQEAANDIIDRWAQLANCWIYDSGTSLQIVTLGDKALTANGYSYTPDLTPVWDIGLDLTDYVTEKGQPPVTVKIKDEADVKNRVTVTITDRAMGYVSNPRVYKTPSLIRRFGRNDANSVQADEVKNKDIGDIIAQLIGRREVRIPDSYEFKTNWRFKRGLPGIIVTLTDPTQNMYKVPVRITDVEEEDGGDLRWQAEGLPGNVGTYFPRPSQAGPTPSTPNLLVDPGNVNTPAVMEPAGQNPGDATKVLIAASGGPNWGGCDVFISFDGVNFGTKAGTINSAAIQGVLTGTLASYSSANPDLSNTLSVDCTISGGEPEPVTNADAAALRTLSLICAPPTTSGSDKVLDPSGELLAFGNTNATGTNTADLTYLYRNAYGTGPQAHAINDLFTLFDLSGQGSTIEYTLPAQYVGQTLYLKFASFNIFEKNPQDLSVCQRYKYTPVGRGFGGGTGGAPTTPTGLVASVPAPQQIKLDWNPNPDTDNVTDYEVYRANGTGASFGSASLIDIAKGPSYLDTTVAPGTGYTYFIKAENVIGLSTASAGANGTSSAIAILGPIYVPSTFVPSTMSANVVLLLHKFGEPSRARANLAGWQFGATANATASTVFTVQRALAASPNTWTTIGTITIAAGTITPTFVSVGGLAYDFAISDVLRIIGSASPDATLADPHITALMDRTG